MFYLKTCKNSSKQASCYRSLNGRVISVLASITLPFSSALAEPTLPGEQDFLGDFSVTSATRLAQNPRDLPVSVTVIDREMIDASGATEIADLFRLVAGFRVGQVTGSSYTVNGHGVAEQYGRKLEVLVDGRRIQSTSINLVDWVALPVEIDDVDYIEVMRGSSAAVYGANAFDGAINIVTRKPFDDRGYKLSITSGEPGVRKTSFRYGFEAGSSQHSIKVSEQYTDGFNDEHDSSRYAKFRYRGNFNPTVNDEVDVQLGVSHGYQEEEGDNVAVRQRPRKTDISSQYLHWKHIQDDGEEFTLKLYHNRTKYDDSYLTANISEVFGVNPALVPVFFGGRQDQPFSFAFYSSTGDRYGVEATQSFSYSAARFVVGASVYHDRIKGEEIFRDGGRSRDLNKQLFGNMEWQLSNDFVINAGLMVEDTNGTSPTFSPRVSFNYHLNPENTFRLGAARSFRSRTSYSKDLFAASAYTSDNAIFDVIVDNRGYDKPEKITTYEFAHLMEMPVQGLGLDWKIYYDHYEDVRNLVDDDNYVDELGNGANVTVNAGDYYVKGVDIQFKYRPGDSGFIAAQYSYAEAGGRIIDEIVPVVEYEEFFNVQPRASFSLLTSKKLFSNWNISAQYSYLGKMEWHGGGDEVGRYERLDARLSRDFKIGASKARLELIGHNLLKEFVDFDDDNIFDRRALIRFSIQN